MASRSVLEYERKTSGTAATRASVLMTRALRQHLETSKDRDHAAQPERPRLGRERSGNPAACPGSLSCLIVGICTTPMVHSRGRAGGDGDGRLSGDYDCVEGSGIDK
jgi:hypothetical protein